MYRSGKLNSIFFTSAWQKLPNPKTVGTLFSLSYFTIRREVAPLKSFVTEHCQIWGRLRIVIMSRSILRIVIMSRLILPLENNDTSWLQGKVIDWGVVCGIRHSNDADRQYEVSSADDAGKHRLTTVISWHLRMRWMSDNVLRCSMTSSPKQQALKTCSDRLQQNSYRSRPHTLHCILKTPGGIDPGDWCTWRHNDVRYAWQAEGRNTDIMWPRCSTHCEFPNRYLVHPQPMRCDNRGIGHQLNNEYRPVIIERSSGCRRRNCHVLQGSCRRHRTVLKIIRKIFV